MSAVGAQMRPHGERLFLYATASRTPLRGLQPACRRFHEQRTSLFRLCSQHGEECGWPGIEYFPVQTSLLSDVLSRLFDRSFGRAGHLGNFKLLSCDQPKPLDQLRAGLVMEVLPPTRILGFQLAATDRRPSAAVRTALAAVPDAFKLQFLVLLRAVKPRIFDRFGCAIRQCQHGERLDAPIQTAGGVAAVTLDDGTLQRQGEVPDTALVHQFARLDRAALPRLSASLHGSDALQAQHTVLPVRSWCESPAIAMAFEAEARHPVERLEARIPRVFARFAATEERIVSLLHPIERDLFGRTVGNHPLLTAMAQLSEASTLRLVRYRNALLIPGVSTLLDGRIIELLMMPQQITQQYGLTRIGIELVSDLAPFHRSVYRLVAMTDQALDALFHCVYSLNYHLVIVTKYRRRVLTKPMLDRFDDLAKERVEAWGGRLIEVNGEPEHVHLLFTLPPKHALADFVNALKTATSRRLRAEFSDEVNRVYRKPVLWSRSYCVISCGGAPLSVIKQYIEQQERPE